jgi:hypothetical protein
MDQIRIALALLSSRTAAERVVADLKTVGIAPDDISILLPESGAFDDVAARAAQPTPSPFAALTGLGTIACGGMETFLAAGPIRAAVDGTPTRTVTAALRAYGVTEPKAAMYEGKVREGSPLVMVRTVLGKDVGEARRILALHGGHAISVTALPHAPTPANAPN